MEPRRYRLTPLNQPIQLLHQFRKSGQGRVHRFAAFHVHAGVAQQIERVFAAAAVEEAEVVVQFLLAAVAARVRLRAIAAERPVAYL